MTLNTPTVVCSCSWTPKNPKLHRKLTTTLLAETLMANEQRLRDSEHAHNLLGILSGSSLASTEPSEYIPRGRSARSWLCVHLSPEHELEQHIRGLGYTIPQQSINLGNTCVYTTLYTLHSTVCTLHSTVYTLHYTLYTLQSTLYTLHSTPYTLDSTLYTLRCTLYTLCPTPHTPHSALHTPHSTFYTLCSTLYTLHSTLYSYTPHFPFHTSHSTLHSPQSTLHTLHSIIYTLHSTL